MDGNYAQALLQNALGAASSQHTGSAAQGLQNAKATPAEIAAKAQEFEAIFIRQMLAMMSPPVDRNSYFTGGSAEETFRDFLYEHYADAVAQKGGIGIAPQVEQQLLQLQEI